MNLFELWRVRIQGSRSFLKYFGNRNRYYRPEEGVRGGCTKRQICTAYFTSLFFSKISIDGWLLFAKLFFSMYDAINSLQRRNQILSRTRKQGKLFQDFNRFVNFANRGLRYWLVTAFIFIVVRFCNAATTSARMSWSLSTAELVLTSESISTYSSSEISTPPKVAFNRWRSPCNISKTSSSTASRPAKGLSSSRRALSISNAYFLSIISFE